MNRLRPLRPSILTAFALVVITGAPTLASAADGVIDLTWGTTCTPLVSATTVGPGGGPLSLIASVTGNDRFHHGHVVSFTLGDPSDQVPDAWRFDPAGCAGPAFLSINHLAPASAVAMCPNFNGNRQSFSIKEYGFAPAGSGLPETVIRGLMANAYPDGVVADPNVRYFLAQFVFNHSLSVVGPTTPGVACGGVETPIIVQALTTGDNASACYLGETGELRAFEPGKVVVTVNDAVPADRTTWGQIKGAYRR